MGMYYDREFYNFINYLKVLIFLEWDIFCFTSKKRKEVSFSLHNSQTQKTRKRRRRRRNGFIRERRKNGRQER